jgi:hypothetical protein
MAFTVARGIASLFYEPHSSAHLVLYIALMFVMIYGTHIGVFGTSGVIGGTSGARGHCELR